MRHFDEYLILWCDGTCRLNLPLFFYFEVCVFEFAFGRATRWILHKRVAGNKRISGIIEKTCCGSSGLVSLHSACILFFWQLSLCGFRLNITWNAIIRFSFFLKDFTCKLSRFSPKPSSQIYIFLIRNKQLLPNLKLPISFTD